MSPDTAPALATVTASVTDASSATFTKSLSVARSLKTESIPVIVPLVPLPKLPITVEGCIKIYHLHCLIHIFNYWIVKLYS